MNNVVVIDVRTPEEFRGGNVKGSINIPLHELQGRVDEIKNISQPIVLCCASGSRSGMATGYLRSLGIDCENAGSWFNATRYSQGF